MKGLIGKIGAVLMNILIWLIVLMAVVFIFISLSSKENRGVPKLLGYSPLTVQSDSMAGDGADNFSQGDMIIIKQVDDFSLLKEGDIITFWDIIGGTRAMNTHRIISIDYSLGYASYYTKGDNNALADEDAKIEGDIIGIYSSHIKGAGKILDFLSSKWGFMVCFVVPLFLFFLWRLWKLIRAAQEYRAAVEAENAANAAREIQADGVQQEDEADNS